MASSIVWFRADLRVSDNPALAAAVRRGGAVLPVFIWAPDEEAGRAPGAAARWWLHHSLTELDSSLRRLGSRLIIRVGPTAATLESLIGEAGADAVFWNRRYEPWAIARDTQIKDSLRRRGLAAESSNAALLFEPWTVKNARSRDGEAFTVFTPFWKAALASVGGEPERPLPASRALPAPSAWPSSAPLESLGLLPRVDWAAGFRQRWVPGEAGAAARLSAFLAESLRAYSDRRDRPDLSATSRLSPFLRWGEISPRQIWHATAELANVTRRGGGAEHFIREVGWREFAFHLLYHFPHTVDRPLQSAFEGFPYRDAKSDAAAERDGRAWRRGQTGVPIVDAGMRELWATGWMHNRTRMIVASQLTKDLLLDWRLGEHWFWDTLVDACPANNLLGWQWTAGVGADAAEYVRIFHPVQQAQKNDPDGDYVRRWVPELAGLPTAYIHKPWAAPAEVLTAAGVRLGESYPRPIVDHHAARVRAEQLYSARMERRPGRQRF